MRNNPRQTSLHWAYKIMFLSLELRLLALLIFNHFIDSEFCVSAVGWVIVLSKWFLQKNSALNPVLKEKLSTVPTVTARDSVLCPQKLGKWVRRYSGWHSADSRKAGSWSVQNLKYIFLLSFSIQLWPLSFNFQDGYQLKFCRHLGRIVA
jgi:hypothetical protein